MINQKTRRPSVGDVPKQECVTPPTQTTTPSSASSPQNRSVANGSPSQAPRYTFDEQHRLPVTFLPFVSTETFKGLDVFGQEIGVSDKSPYESPVEVEDSWFRMEDEPTSAFAELQMRARSESKATILSSARSVTIGWIKEDGFKPIGEYDD
jgi:hypothetical protein